MTNRVRYFQNNKFISTLLPEITIRFPAAFSYIGQTDFTLHEIARVDRHHLLAVNASGSVHRMVILHFESFISNTDQTFNYRLPEPPNHAGPDFRFSLEKIKIGGHEYIHNTWFFDANQNIRENPAGELIRTAQLFKEHGYLLPAELQMSRYVRVVDAERKSELILFYMEPLEPTGCKAADFIVGGPGELVFDKLSAELTQRSSEVFGDVIEG